MSKLLFSESPLVVDVLLATKLGVDAAIVLQQINYWIVINQRKNINFYEGAYWTYNSIKDWNKDFPFYTERTLQRIFKKLKDLEILKPGNFNKAKFDKTMWYTIDYEKLEQIVEGVEDVTTSRQNGNIDERKHVNDDDKLATRERQNGETMATNWHNEGDKMATPIPETSTEITTKTSSETYIPTNQNAQVGKQVDSDAQNSFSCYEQNFGAFVPKTIKDTIISYLEDGLSSELICYIIMQCAEGQKKWPYGKAILNTCVQDKIYTVQQFEIRREEFRAAKSKQDENTGKPKIVSKNPAFTTMYSHGWDFDELDRMAQDHLDKILGDDKNEPHGDR